MESFISPMIRLSRFRPALNLLTSAGLHYAILRTPPLFPLKISDLDIIIDSEDLEKSKNIYADAGYKIEVSGSHTFVARNKVKIDIVYRLNFLDGYIKNENENFTRAMIEKRKIKNGLYFLPKDIEVLLLLLRMRSRDQFFTKYSYRIRKMLPNLSNTIGSPELGLLDIDLRQLENDFNASNNQIYWWSRITHKKRQVAKAIKLFTNYCKIVLKRERLYLIVFLGPDGSGKTTLSTQLEHRFPEKYTYVTMAMSPKRFIFNNTLLGAIRKMRTYKKKSSNIFAKGFFYLMISFISYVEILIRLVRIIPMTGQKRVIVDRYFGIDSQTCPQRMSNYVGRKVNNLLFPKPLGVILLGGSGTKIHQRKSDMDKGEIDKSLLNYFEFLKNNGIPYRFIDTVANDLNQCTEFADKYLDELFNLKSI